MLQTHESHVNVRCRESVPTSALSRLEIMIRFSRNYNGLMNTGSLLGSVEEMIPGLLSRYFEKSLLGDDIYTPPPPALCRLVAGRHPIRKGRISGTQCLARTSKVSMNVC